MTCEGCILFPSATAEGMAMSIQKNSSLPCLSRPVDLQVPTYALRALEVLEDAGFEAWIVGGYETRYAAHVPTILISQHLQRGSRVKQLL